MDEPNQGGESTGIDARTAIGGLLLVLVIVGGFVLYQNKGATTSPTATSTAPAMLDYTNDTFGISFKYPETYALTEGEVGNSERGHYVITLVAKRALPVPEGSEGPPAVTVEMFQNVEKQTLTDWLTKNGASNYKLGKGDYATTTLPGDIPAVIYSWSGLYEADSVAFIHRGVIYMITGGYIQQDDETRLVLLNLLTTLALK